MHPKNFREPVRDAVAELEAALAGQLDEDIEGELAGVTLQLEYYLECDTTDPEAIVYPPPWAIETLQERLDDCLARTDGSTATHIRNAHSALERTVPALVDRENDGRPINSP